MRSDGRLPGELQAPSVDRTMRLPEVIGQPRFGGCRGAPGVADTVRKSKAVHCPILTTLHARVRASPITLPSSRSRSPPRPMEMRQQNVCACMRSSIPRHSTALRSRANKCSRGSWPSFAATTYTRGSWQRPLNPVNLHHLIHSPLRCPRYTNALGSNHASSRLQGPRTYPVLTG